MAYKLPNGAIVEIASGYVAADTVTAASNANPAVLTTSAAHGITDGKYFEFVSGWARANNRIFRATAASGSAISPEGLNTTDTSVYPAGSGTGTIREISGWTQLQQILNSSSTGGEQQFTEFQPLEGNAKIRIPTSKSASGVTFSIGDDPTLAGYLLASTANDDRQQRAVRITLSDGSKLLYNAYISLNRTPSLTVDEVMAVEVTLSLLNEPTRYAT